MTLDDGGTCLVHVWNDEEDYWPSAVGEEGPFAPASGLDLFEAAHAELSAVGVRVPRVLLLDRATPGRGCPGRAARRPVRP
ncbi:hypothetical protein [Micromonospora sp. DT47]|uniref:hypothetical protein n=1 Tax=Micromonospora sp. DT47 TaxID=3393431 RepID=UPI003CEDA2E3